MIVLLVILHIGVYGLHRGSRIPLTAAKRVMDAERFENYSWGRDAFQSLITSIKVASLNGDSYTIYGCVHVLLIWAFEFIPLVGEKVGNKIEDADNIPLLRWSSGRKRFVFEELIKEDMEKSEDKKVCVRHLVVKPIHEIYPVWPNNISDPKVDNVIQDIIANTLDESFWPVCLAKTHKRKQSAAANGSKKMAKKGKMKITEDVDVEDTSDDGMNISLLEFLKNEKKKEKAEAEASTARDLGIMNVLENLASQFVVLGEKMNKMEGNLTRAQEKMAERMSEMENNFQELQQNVSDRILLMEAKLHDRAAPKGINVGPSSIDQDE